MEEDLPLVSNYKAIETFNHQRVRLKGVYQQFDTRMRQEKPKKLFLGHVAIDMEDGVPVLLYPSDKPEAIRSKKERRKMKGSEVIIIGVIYQYTPKVPGSSSRNLPCIMDIESIEKVK